MRFSKPLGIALLALAAQSSAWSGELAVLRNGNSIRYERREQAGDITRLYTGNNDHSYVEVATDSIASFEPEAPSPRTESQDTAWSMASSTPPASIPQAVQPTPAAPANDLDSVVREAGSRYRLDPDFVRSVIKAESNFQPRAVSPKGAQGLMQLMPGTAASLGVKNPFDPKANVEGGTAYLSQLFDLYHNDPIKALAAYNAGALRVQQYHGVPPYSETRAYIARIVRDFNAQKLAQMKLAQAKTASAPVAIQKPAAPASSTGARAGKKALPGGQSKKGKVQPASTAVRPPNPSATE